MSQMDADVPLVVPVAPPPLCLSEASLTAILGPARCGKSERLMERALALVTTATAARVLYVVPNLVPAETATAAAPQQETTLSLFTRESPRPLAVRSLAEISLHSSHFDTLVVDDAHFIPDFSDVALCLTLQGVSVLFAALNNNLDGVCWPSLARAIACADRYEHMECQCANCHERVACMSYRLPLAPDQVGSAYQPVCRGCFRHIRAYESPTVTPIGSPPRKLSTPRSYSEV